MGGLSIGLGSGYPSTSEPCPGDISSNIMPRNINPDTWMHLGMAMCCLPTVGHCDNSNFDLL